MHEKYEVTKEDVGQRLDLYLTFKSGKLSRSMVKKQIEKNNIYVNGEVEFRPNYKVSLGDKIEARYEDQKIPFDKIVPQNIPLKIIYEDDDLLAIDKPAGMVVHPATSNWDNTLLNAVAYKYKEMENVGDKTRAGLIHRLDKDTSGVVLVGKTNKALWYYTKLFSQREVKKTYIALVRGDFASKLGIVQEVENYLGRNERNRKKFTKVPPSKGRLAKTTIKFVKLVKKPEGIFSLVEAYPETGRTHQIRVHLSSLGFPIMGDIVYGKGNDYKRLMLHAWKLELKLMSGKVVEIESKPENIFFN